MKILALDLSLTCTGWCTNPGVAHMNGGTLEPPKGRDRGMWRLEWIRHAVLMLAAPVDLVVIEGYSFSSRHSHAHALGELGGVVRLALFERKIPYVDVPPSSLKLFATGKGNAAKDVVFGEAIRKLGYAGHSKDEADALWLYEMAHAQYVAGATNAHQRKALAAVDWPLMPDSAGDVPQPQEEER